MAKTIIVKKASIKKVAPVTSIRHWTKKEVSFLKENYKKIKTSVLANTLNRTVNAVHFKAVNLGLVTKRSPRIITETVKIKEPNRNSWTNKEVKFLRQNYKKMSLKELSDKLGRSIGSVSGKLFGLKLKKGRNTIANHKAWTEEETTYLNQNYYKMSKKSIAKRLGRSVSSVASRQCATRKEEKQVKAPQIVNSTEVNKKGSTWATWVLVATNIITFVALSLVLFK